MGGAPAAMGEAGLGNDRADTSRSRSSQDGAEYDVTHLKRVHHLLPGPGEDREPAVEPRREVPGGAVEELAVDVSRCQSKRCDVIVFHSGGL
ncbi:MAG TPA: hypothetical protein VM347_17190 [Nonomuraea sp.]|nr:hypothetical protein [Nonomuraea sp.]